MRKAWAAAAVIVGVGALALLWPRSPGGGSSDPLAALGFTETSGAAPSYVEDRACALCHHDLAASYQHVGMGRSFFQPSAAAAIEDFTHNRYTHPASGRVYEMEMRGDELLFRRYQLDAEGQRVNLFEQKVDWVLGSGNHSRTYLYRTPGGEVYQLPLAWYSQGQGWGMAPGYDRPDHNGVLRRVRRECMFCHNAYPNVPAGSDAYGQPHTFPAELPQGIGCQRCHGPGAEHSRLALDGAAKEAIRAAVVNPEHLAPRQRDDVCYQCHMQPTVALPGVRRFGLGDYAFRPGQALADFRVDVDVEEANRTPEQRFEINHHPYRLEQSRCFLASIPGTLSCLTCHDPHRTVPAEQRQEHFRRACLTCHQVSDCQLQGMAAGTPGHEAVPAGGGDCAGCHMPRRHTQDVIHVVMTDHLIQRRPPPDALAPLAETDPELVGVTLRRPESSPVVGEIYRAMAVVQMAGAASGEAVEYLETHLASAQLPYPEPYLEAARAELKQRRYATALANLQKALELNPDQPQAEDWAAIAEIGIGQRQQGLERLQRIAASNAGGRSESLFNLGRVQAGSGLADEAIATFQQLLALSPNHAAGWFQLGNIYRRSGRPDDALPCYRRSLELDPGAADVYLAEGETLLELGRREEALHLLRLGARVALRPEPVRAALDRLEGK